MNIRTGSVCDIGGSMAFSSPTASSIGNIGSGLYIVRVDGAGWAVGSANVVALTVQLSSASGQDHRLLSYSVELLPS